MARDRDDVAAELERRVRSLETTRQVALALAVIFGLSGTFVAAKLKAAHDQIDGLQQGVRRDAKKAIEEAISNGPASEKIKQLEHGIDRLEKTKLSHVALGTPESSAPWFAGKDQLSSCGAGRVMVAVRGGAQPGETAGMCSELREVR